MKLKVICKNMDTVWSETPITTYTLQFNVKSEEQKNAKLLVMVSEKEYNKYSIGQELTLE